MPAASNRNREVRRVLVVILGANLAVVAVKLAVAASTHSLAVLGDVIHSSLDALNNAFGLAVVRFAARGPDEEHPYGHAKFETLGALLVVVVLSVSIFELLKGSIQRLATGAPPPSLSLLAAGLLGLTFLVNVAVVRYETAAGRRLKSELLLADAVHTRTDVWITLAVLGGLILSQRGVAWADPVLAMVVSALVAFAGFGIVRRAIPSLVDERAHDSAAIRDIAERVAGVRSAYGIRSRRAADLSFAELTIAVDGAKDVAEAHQIADQVEHALHGTLELNQVTVHVEPC